MLSLFVGGGSFTGGNKMNFYEGEKHTRVWVRTQLSHF